MILPEFARSTEPSAPCPTVELETALALARASTAALLNLSPLAHREMVAALCHEVAELESRGDARSRAVAQAIRPILEAA